MSDVLEERGGYRVRLELDDSPEQPYDDGQSPILHIDFGSRGWAASHIDPGTHRPRDCDAAIAHAAEHFGADRDSFDRYLRAFHGVTQVATYEPREGGWYVTYDDKAWREKTGAPAGSASLTEWQAYVEGDVYGYIVEKQVTWTTDAEEFDDREAWEEIDSCWGFYGREYAEESAREAFAETLPDAS